MSESELSHGISKPKDTVHQLKMKQSQELKALSKSTKGKAFKEKEKDMLSSHDNQLKELQDAWNLFRLAEEGNLPAKTEAVASGDSSEFKLYNEREVVVSKAMKKKLAREAREKQREDEVRAELANRPDVRVVEDTKFAPIFARIKFDGSFAGLVGGKVKAIRGDGHCLFAAVVDQLDLHAATEGKHSCGYTVASMRKLSSDYMRANKDDFIPFLIEDDDDDIMSHDDMEVYCNKLMNMDRDIMLGGHGELVALSHQLKRTIAVYLTDSATVIIGEEYKDKEPTLHLSYHKHYAVLGEHYNSIVPMTSGNNDDDEDDEEED